MSVVLSCEMVGTLLRHYRRERGIDQSYLALALGVSQSTYSRIESGRAHLSVVRMAIICRLLGVSPNQLLGWD